MSGEFRCCDKWCAECKGHHVPGEPHVDRTGDWTGWEVDRIEHLEELLARERASRAIENRPIDNVWLRAWAKSADARLAAIQEALVKVAAAPALNHVDPRFVDDKHPSRDLGDG